MSHRVYWHRQDNDQDTHPDILEVGPRAAIVFRLLCRMAGKGERRGASEGFIPSKAANPRHLARILGKIEGLENVEAWIRVGLETLLAYDPPEDEGDRLLERAEGGVRIVAWKEKKADPTAAERKRRQRVTENQEDRDPVTVTPEESGDVTPGACVTPEERRGEESKGEDPENPHGRPADAGPGRPGVPKALIESQAMEVLTWVRQNTDARWKGPSKFLRARLRDGYTPTELVEVIAYYWPKWAGTDQEDFLRQKTLFDRDNLEGYHDTVETAKNAGRFRPITLT